MCMCVQSSYEECLYLSFAIYRHVYADEVDTTFSPKSIANNFYGVIVQHTYVKHHLNKYPLAIRLHCMFFESDMFNTKGVVHKVQD